MPIDWIDTFTAAAHLEVELPEGWIGYLFEARRGQGIDVTGVVVTKAISRGPRKGEPNFRAADPATKRTVFVSNATIARAEKAAKAEGRS